MRKLLLILALTLYVSSAMSQRLGVLWYLPTMTTYQADNLAQYSLIIIDPENFFTNPERINEIIKINPDIKIWLYVNPTEIFEPMFPDKPWSIKLLAELQKKKEWWLYQPDGQKLGAWTGMKALDMRADCPRIYRQRYWQFIAKEYLKIMKDKRITGCLLDNTWGDDRVGIEWLATYNNQKGLDLDQDGKADTDFRKINSSWTKGTKLFIRKIHRRKRRNFTIVANPGNLSYREVDGKQFENFPYKYHQLKSSSDWEANMLIARKFDIVIINPDHKDYFFGACSATLIDNAYLCIGQNELYHDYYNLDLGKPKGRKKEVSNGIYSRKFERGSVFIDATTKKAWIIYNDGQKRER